MNQVNDSLSMLEAANRVAEEYKKEAETYLKEAKESADAKLLEVEKEVEKKLNEANLEADRITREASSKAEEITEEAVQEVKALEDEKVSAKERIRELVDLEKQYRASLENVFTSGLTSLGFDVSTVLKDKPSILEEESSSTGVTIEEKVEDLSSTSESSLTVEEETVSDNTEDDNTEEN